MAVQDNWQYLRKDEKCTVTELTGNRRIRDWNGYTDGMDSRRHSSSDWVKERLAWIKENMGQPDDAEEHRKERKAYLEAMVTEPYLDYLYWNVPDYPRADATDTESAFIKERAYYCSFFGEGKKDSADTTPPPYEELQTRKGYNYDWLMEHRQWLVDCANGDIDGQEAGWDIKARRQRKDNMDIAVHKGDAWEQWQAGNYVPRDERASWRDKSGKWHDGHLGITEDPANSNCDKRSDGIRNAQDTCANGTWLRYQPWCGVWAFMGLYQSGKVTSGTDSWMASVASIEDYAKAARGPFRGWTTDGSKAKKGDLVVLFGRGQHVGTVRSVDSSYCHTWEGNTSAGSGGSQSNGGGSYKRSRSRSTETYGYALVRD